METLLDLLLSGNWAADFAQSEVAKMTLAFLIAARAHRAWVKKDMAEQFGLLKNSIDHVAGVLGKRLDGLEERVEKLEDK